MTVITPDDVEHYLNADGAQQKIDEWRKDFPRWIRQIDARGLAEVPLALGSQSARWLDLMIYGRLEKDCPDDPRIREIAHNLRDTFPELRKYKGPGY
jgi:hypothetical protein